MKWLWDEIKFLCPVFVAMAILILLVWDYHMMLREHLERQREAITSLEGAVRSIDDLLKQQGYTVPPLPAQASVTLR